MQHMFYIGTYQFASVVELGSSINRTVRPEGEL